MGEWQKTMTGVGNGKKDIREIHRNRKEGLNEDRKTIKKWTGGMARCRCERGNARVHI
jgi:hypothetical protein